MLRIYKTQGIVIRRRNLNESDKLLTVYTSDFGKVRVLAKGVRKIKSRRAAHLELFHHVSMTLAKGKQWDIVIEAQLINAHVGIRTDLTKVAYAYRIAEGVDILCAENESQYLIFSSLSNVLTTISGDPREKTDKITDDFLLKLLKMLGYLPHDSHLSGVRLKEFLITITERSLRSDRLLEKL